MKKKNAPTVDASFANQTPQPKKEPEIQRTQKKEEVKIEEEKYQHEKEKPQSSGSGSQMPFVQPNNMNYEDMKKGREQLKNMVS